MKQLIGYIRVSTDEQAKEGYSLAAQTEAIKKYCAFIGADLLDVIIDPGVSAGKKPLKKRSGGQKLLKLINQKKPDGVVVWKLDRLFRSASDCLTITEEWNKKKVALHLLDIGGQNIDTSTSVGKFFFTVMAAAAEFERNQIIERTKAGMDHLRNNKKRISRFAPFGYQLIGNDLVPHEKEQIIIRRVIKLKKSGHTHYRIAKIINEEGHRSRSNGYFNQEQIKRMLKNVG